MIRSANAILIPGVRAGFTGFQPVPLTSGWLEISGSWNMAGLPTMAGGAIIRRLQRACGAG